MSDSNRPAGRAFLAAQKADGRELGLSKAYIDDLVAGNRGKLEDAAAGLEAAFGRLEPPSFDAAIWESVSRSNQEPPLPSDGESRGNSGQVGAQPVSVPTKPRKRKPRTTMSREEMEAQVGAYLKKHRDATIEEVKTKFDLGRGTVSGLRVWRKVQSKREGERTLKRKTRSLTPEMLASIPARDAATSAPEFDAELVECEYLQTVEPADRAEFYAMEANEKENTLWEYWLEKRQRRTL